MNKEKLINIYRNMNRKEIVDDIIEDLLYFRDLEGIIYANLNVKTGDISVRFSSYPHDFENCICLSKYETGHLEEALPSPSDLPEHIRCAEDDIAEYFKTYGMDIIEFISEKEFIKELENKIN